MALGESVCSMDGCVSFGVEGTDHGRRWLQSRGRLDQETPSNAECRYFNYVPMRTPIHLFHCLQCKFTPSSALNFMRKWLYRKRWNLLKVGHNFMQNSVEMCFIGGAGGGDGDARRNRPSVQLPSDMDPDELIAQRYLRRGKSKQGVTFSLTVLLF